MLISNDAFPILTSQTLNIEAEKELIKQIINGSFFKGNFVQRRLGLYAYIEEAEKDLLILELMEHYWNTAGSKKLFTSFRDFDVVLTILGKKGHFIHQFEVFLLGCFLIKILTRFSPSLFESTFANQNHLFYGWLYASTAHDFGYPLQLAEKLSDKFAGLYKKLHIRGISKEYEKICKDYSLSSEKALFQTKIWNPSKKKWQQYDTENFLFEGIKLSLNNDEKASKEVSDILKEKNNHGYTSALILCRSYLSFLSKANKGGLSSQRWRVKALQLAAAAIALHAIPSEQKKYLKKINFNANPLAYLLFIIDSLQEWNRAISPSVKWPNRSRKPKHEWPAYHLASFNVLEKSLEFRYIVLHEKWSANLKNKTLEAIKEKALRIKCPSGPSPSLGFTIIISFYSSNNSILDKTWLRI